MGKAALLFNRAELILIWTTNSWLPARATFYFPKAPRRHLRGSSSSNLAQIRLRARLSTPVWLVKRMFPIKKHYLLTWCFSFVFSAITYIELFYSSPAAIGSLSPAPLMIPPTAVQTRCYFLPPYWMYALKDSNIPHNPPFFFFSPFSTFMDFAFLYSGQRDGCCVMSVIALILPFSQHFNLFMLLPNLNWAIICILYMITFPLAVVWQLWGLCFHAGLCNIVFVTLTPTCK